jgi:transposase
MLFVGDDWSEEHHDIGVQDEAGRVLARVRLPEGVAGIDRLHTLIAMHSDDAVDLDDVDLEVAVGIETERGPWVQALVASGYQVHAINPLQVARYRESHSISGAKSDTVDAHVLAEMVRSEGHRLATVAGDSEQAAAIKVVARGHKTMIWERTRHMLRLRNALRDFFPAALVALPI